MIVLCASVYMQYGRAPGGTGTRLGTHDRRGEDFSPARIGCKIVDGRTSVTLGHRLIPHRKLAIKCAVETYVFRDTPTYDVDSNWVSRARRSATPADPAWCERAPANMILGADVVSQLLEGPSDGRPGKLLPGDYFWRSLLWRRCKTKMIRGSMVEIVKTFILFQIRLPFKYFFSLFSDCCTI